jgi:16S rRNA (guanine527-N7)-methyltransferase
MFHGERSMVSENKLEPDSAHAAREALSRFLASAEYRLDPSTQDRLVDLALLLVQWGSGMNLSGYREPESVMEGLICDGLALWFAYREQPVFESPGDISDLGAGAGFPGLPLAILEPRIRVTLVESRRRRHHFQRAARRELALDNVHPRLGRIEGLEPMLSDLVVAQAVAQPGRALELGLPWLREGGLILIPGNSPDLDPTPNLSIGRSGVFSYSVLGREKDRWLWWGQKTSV